MTKTTNKLNDAMTKVTQQVIDAMEQHGTNWQKPWASKGGAMASGLPINTTSRKAYRGINIMLLSGAGYSSNEWGTFKQWKDKGAKVAKGQKASRIYLWKPLEVVDKDKNDGSKKTIWMIKEFCVFNADQVEDYDAPTVTVEPTVERDGKFTNAAFEAYVKNTGAKLIADSSAYFSPVRDVIGMPVPSDFVGTETSSASESYYSTLAHELTHWTGHKSRLDRLENGGFGSETYAKEELVAELGAVFLTIQFGINSAPRPDHAQYLNGWISKLKNDKRALFMAASAAQKAIDHLAEYQGASELVDAA